MVVGFPQLLTENCPKVSGFPEIILERSPVAAPTSVADARHDPTGASYCERLLRLPAQPDCVELCLRRSQVPFVKPAGRPEKHFTSFGMKGD